MKREVAVALGIYVCCLGSASLFWDRPLIVFFCYLLLSGFMLLRWHSSADLVSFFAAMVLGTIADLVAVSAGVWEYGKPLYLIPVWLPLGWGVIGLFLKRVSDALVTSA